MKDFRLYFIADIKPDMTHPPVSLVAQAVAGGVDIVQLRYKGATKEELLALGRELKPLVHFQNIPFIINDNVEAALELGADGVHLGQDDMPVKEARGLLGPNKIIGKSTHSLAQALAAQEEGVDYLAIGPVFPTTTKEMSIAWLGTDVLKKLARVIHIPWLAIGGINKDNLLEVVFSGTERVAVVSAIAGADDVSDTARELKSFLCRMLIARRYKG